MFSSSPHGLPPGTPASSIQKQAKIPQFGDLGMDDEKGQDEI